VDRFTPGKSVPVDPAKRVRPLRVGYVSGPSDADRIYEDLKSDRPRTYFGTNYMRQFLLLMDELGAEALIETWYGDRKYRRRIGRHVFNNVPEGPARGLSYHLQAIGQMLGILWRLLWFHPDVVVLTGKQEYWWLLSPLRLTGTRLVASFHGAIWPPFRRLRPHERVLRLLNQHLILRHLAAAVATSRRLSDQFLELAGARGPRTPLFNHLPSWEPQQFDGIAPAQQLPAAPFKIMFMGRIEGEKGIYDLLDIAVGLQRERPGEFEFHVCGDGTELSEVRRLVEERRLSGTVQLHGYCPPERMRDVMSLCHAVVVPTRAECPAGFEMTCAEAILGGRPLVTSAAAPAIDYLRPALLEVAPDNVAAYKAAIIRMKDDPTLYRDKQEACGGLRDQFFSYGNSWDFAMREAFAAVFPDRLERPAVRSC